MESKYISFNDQINRVVKTPVDQGRIVAMAVALAVSAKAMLPSSAVENTSDYFAANVSDFAKQTISELGEGVTFSSKTALEYVGQFWKMRYNAAHPAVTLESALRYQLASLALSGKESPYDFSMMWAGGEAAVSRDAAAFLEKFKIEILTLASSVYPLLEKEEVNG
jgi:hypothetical protein